MRKVRPLTLGPILLGGPPFDPTRGVETRGEGCRREGVGRGRPKLFHEGRKEERFVPRRDVREESRSSTWVFDRDGVSGGGQKN